MNHRPERMTYVQSILAAAMVMLLAACGSSPRADEGEVPQLKIHQHGHGVLLRDDFSQDQWAPHWWPRPWVQDMALKVYVQDGKMRITGTSGDPVPVCADHHEFRFTGLVSRNLVERDVVLAATMQVLSPLPEGTTRARYIVHLCGADPDYFLDAALCHEPDGREGWFFNALGDGHPISHDFAGPFLPLDDLPADQPYTIVIDHDDESKISRGFIVDDGVWTSLGQHRLFLATTQVELKVDVPYNGVAVDVAFDDVRLYRRPKTAPVRFIVKRPPFPGFPFAGVKVRLLDVNGQMLGEARTDRDGEVSLTMPEDRLYPLACTVELQLNGRTLGRATIDAVGVQGMYPGDVWIITAPEEFRYTGPTYPLGY